MASLSNMGQLAIDLSLKGFYVIPLCWPNTQGMCACPQKHTGHNIGKAPLTPRGINNSSKEIRQIWDWWLKWPDANIAVDLDKSGLIAIAPDSEVWHQTFLSYGMPETYTVQSGGGPGHVHYIYRRPDNTPLINDNKSNQYDIQPRGYVVAEGSLHQSGQRYTCISAFLWKDVEDLPLAPDWVIKRIKERWEESKNTPQVEIGEDMPPPLTHLIKGRLKDWWEGRKFVETSKGTADRSATLVAIARMLAATGAKPAEIVVALRDRDENLGYYKYSRRRDGGAKAYTAIASLAVNPNRQPQNTLQNYKPGGIPSAPEWLTYDNDVFENEIPYLPDQPLAASGHPESPTAIGQSRKKAMYLARKAANPKVDTSVVQSYQVFLPYEGRSYQRLTLLTELPCMCSTKIDLLDGLQYVIDSESGKTDKATRAKDRLESCGKSGSMVCPMHGDRRETRETCKEKFHMQCPSQTTNRLASAEPLPDFYGLETYREVWIEVRIALRDEDSLTTWSGQLRDMCQKWQDTVSEHRKKKVFSDRLSHRMIAVYVGKETVFHCKFMVKEDYIGQFNAVVDSIESTMRGTARVEKRYQSGEMAICQQMEDSCASLIGFDRSEMEYFSAWWHGMPRNQYQSYGFVRKALAKVSKPEREICDVEGCGLYLFFHKLDTSTQNKGLSNTWGEKDDEQDDGTFV